MRFVYLMNGLYMQKALVPIYALPIMLLEKVNPKFFAANSDLILRSSLAAQDYYLSGRYYEYDHRTGRLFKKLPGYISVHREYNLPYNPNTIMLDSPGIHPGLVMDLAYSFQTDKLNNIIDANGDVKDINTLPSSEILHVYHNSQSSGVPVNALRFITPSQLEKMLAMARNQKTK